MKNIAVIGAGPMGLTCAYYLLKQGHSVTVFEAGDTIGGMSAAFDFDGLLIERYYHFVCAMDQPLFELLEELGIQDKLRWKETKMGFYYEGTLYDWGNPIALLTFPKLDLFSKLRYGLMAFYATKRTNGQGLNKANAVTWIKKWVGEKAYKILWKSLFDLKFYQYSDNLSAAWIWTRIRRVGTSRKNMFTEKMGYMEGGSETIIQRLKTLIEQQGGIIKTEAIVDKVLIAQGQVKGVKVNQQKMEFDMVISTIPTPYIADMIPDLPKPIVEQFKQLNNIAVVCVIVKLRSSVTENFWLNINDQRMDIPGIVEYSNLNDTGDNIVYIPYYIPADNEKYQDSDEVFEMKVKQYLKMINPNLEDGDFLSIHVSRYRFAQPICEPDFMSKLPPIKLPLKGLFVADTSYYYPEDRSICESVKLAKEIVDQCGSIHD
jgi:protoporphyrinogen oxidase